MNGKPIQITFARPSRRVTIKGGRDWALGWDDTAQQRETNESSQGRKNAALYPEHSADLHEFRDGFCILQED
jgi:hypothetical protein